MSSYASLVDEIVRAPVEETPRLVLADWLEERGDPRGEFIRTQCELARLEESPAEDPDGARRAALESRELQLVRRHSKGWAGAELRRIAKSWWFRRGMIEGVRLSTNAFLQHGEWLRRQFPLAEISLCDAADRLELLAESPLLSGIRRLDLSGSAIGRGGNPQGPHWRERQSSDSPYHREQRARTARLETLLRSPQLSAVEHLGLASNHLGGGLRDVLTLDTTSSFLARLVGIDLSDNGVDHAVVEALAEAAPGLHHLTLSSCANVRHNYDEDWVGPLMRALASFAGRLRVLSIPRCGVTSYGLDELRQHAWPHLESLTISGSITFGWQDDPPGCDLVFGAPWLARLRQLDASSCYFEATHLNEITSTRCLAHVERLSIANNRLDATSGAVAARLRTGPLRCLTFDGGGSRFQDFGPTNLGDDTALAWLEGLPQLGSLSLRRQHLTPQFARGLASRQDQLERLYHFDLRHNRLGDEGAAALCELGPWPRLALLNVRDNQLGAEAKARLRATFGERVVY